MSEAKTGSNSIASSVKTDKLSSDSTAKVEQAKQSKDESATIVLKPPQFDNNEKRRGAPKKPRDENGQIIRPQQGERVIQAEFIPLEKSFFTATLFNILKFVIKIFSYLFKVEFEITDQEVMTHATSIDSSLVGYLNFTRKNIPFFSRLVISILNFCVTLATKIKLKENKKLNTEPEKKQDAV